MRWKPLCVLACGAALMSWEMGRRPAAAQPPTARSSRIRLPTRRPVTSPYLNLLGGNGRSFAFNYFRGVKPELEFRAADARMSRSLNTLRRDVNRGLLRRDESSQLGPTGHAATFMNLGTYFPTLNRATRP